MAVTADQSAKARFIQSNRDEYGETYHQLNFPTAEQAARAERQRSELLDALGDRLHISCNGSKLNSGMLAPGCRICTEGRWSCLFINGRCNRSCFYCPSPQDETGLPGTNTLNFHSPADYAEYLQLFDFHGMSLSGGEPLLTPGRSLAFLRAAKHRFGDRLHTWFYTNGSLVTLEALQRLRDAGLNEIRFDIGAVGYSLEKVRLAAGLIPTVTIEIPAVPEEAQRLKKLFGPMTDLGVKHLNLHQLRLTPHNLQQFIGRPYTFLHGAKVTVLESELTALDLLRDSVENHPSLSVNYCSFVYKNRYQKAAARSRGALYLARPGEERTAAGFLRTLVLNGAPEHLQGMAEQFIKRQVPTASWALTASGKQLHFARDLQQLIDFTDCRLDVRYASTSLLERVSYLNPFKQLPLPSGRTLIVERNRVAEFSLSGEQIRCFFQSLDRPYSRHAGDSGTLPAALRTCEEPETGLQQYC